mmetsp:Transcript_5109/g.6410  ORF Transcript_5109/g.6410 Transcript_5109/m.6410 type:complete len:109 (+) Transcript_5109:197-523(+)|eukprot:CAMPEP_0172524648 /NCGR_PEP_ID=MMETSP1066-20121228/294298_1 /TAXON_ID=671091 /ORGANISM="Coscinodiscus wailesii, Strain CCMP2513" /LENGTH=108 /DNA_ID=CAMNT_0013307791 /DNA_START=175 /DNA_END=501 /DNA_ORIENTATION=+
MVPRIFLIVAAIILAASSIESFAPSPAFSVTSSGVTTALEACRTNAKKEKRQRNRDNMRKFMKKGGSRRKQLRKMAANQQRQLENEFIAKCFTTTSAPEEPEKKQGRY